MKTTMVEAPVIGFAGMTHLGINSAVAASERGFRVIGFDVDEDLCANLRAGRPPILEPDLVELMSKNSSLLDFSSDAAILTACDVVYVSSDVPTNDAGQSNITPVHDLIKLVDAAMLGDAVLVVLSQVPPGFMSSLKLDRKYVYYQVETLIFGLAISRAMNPERYIVGCVNPETPLPVSYKIFLEAHDCQILTMRFESAELAKIAINCFLVSSVSVTNTLAELCEQVGADWSEIAPALRLDRRIGPYAYLSPGLGLSGGNLERDLATVIQLSASHETDSGVVMAWINNSHHRKEWAHQVILRELVNHAGNPIIAVLGLAYKPDTDSTKNSPAFVLLENLKSFSVQVYDPVVAPIDAPHCSGEAAVNALEACKNADVVAIMTAWNEFRALDPLDIANAMSGDLVIDPYRVLNGEVCKSAGLRYVTLGQGDLVCNPVKT